MIRCKFRCIEKKQVEGWGDHKFLWQFEFLAVIDSNEVNKKYWAATPSGAIQMGSIMDDAFEVGQEYYVDFTRVDQ